jgi:thiol:disulfide interchange protein
LGLLLGYALACLLVSSRHVAAQNPFNGLTNNPLNLGPGDKKDEQKISVAASVEIDPKARNGRLHVRAKIVPNWHTYSLTQPKGGPRKTMITVTENPAFKVIGEFKPDAPPHVTHDWPGKPELNVEQHEKQVEWSAPIELAEGVDPLKVAVAGVVSAMVCSGGTCLPSEDYTFVAKPDGGAVESQSAPPTPASANPPAPPVAPPNPTQPSTNSPPPNPLPAPPKPTSTSFAPPEPEKTEATSTVAPPLPDLGVAIGEMKEFHGERVSFRGKLERRDAGKSLKVTITASPESGWHIYSLADKDPQTVAKPTLFRIASPSNLCLVNRTMSVAPTEKSYGSGKVFYHSAPVTWTWTLAPNFNRENGKGQHVAGVLGFQVCSDDDQGCLAPTGLRFSGQLAGASESTSLTFEEATYREASLLAGASVEPVITTLATDGTPVEATSLLGFEWILLYSLIGGFLLNLMPCVLPVIGLKILSFVEQSGQSRTRIMLLNACYSLGILLVLMVLATCAVVFKLGWGEQFGNETFNVIMLSTVFVMALSFLGVWEIPVPGFVGSGKANNLSQQEGVVGAVSKGVITTILATPCSGPFLGGVFGSILSLPPAKVYLIFAFVGIGMSLPYLVIGAFPSLLRSLPKPGNWMNIFKEVMGFILLGTVLFLFRSVRESEKLYVLGLLLGLGMACWWIGKTPLYEGAAKISKAYLSGALMTALVGGLTYYIAAPSKTPLPWEVYTPAKFASLQKEGKTVLIDFSADWCATCQINLRRAINTPEVLKVVEQNSVVPLLADYTDTPPEIKKFLNQLGYNSIPVLAVFPGDGHPPICKPDLISKTVVLAALEEAGPSQSNNANKTAMRGEETK